jgi:hypothetical protein
MPNRLAFAFTLFTSLALDLACQGPGATAITPPGPDRASARDFTDGGRLVARRLTAPGADPLLTGIVDRQTGQECRFLLAEDGQLRCLPWAPDLAATGTYADAACRVPLFTRALAPRCDGRPPSRLVTIARPATGCAQEGGHEVRAVSPATPDLREHQLRDGEGCAPVAAPRRELFVGQEVMAAAAWVSGREELSAGAGRLARAEVVASDGGRFTQALHDRRWGRPCDPLAETSPGSGRCLEASAVLAGFFADADCGQPVAMAPTTCAGPALVRGPDLQAFALGARHTGPVFARGERGCERFELPAPWPFFAVGAALGADAEAPLSFPALGDGRLALRHAADQRGAPLSSALAVLAGQAPFADRTLGADCAPVRTATGGLRCLPPALSGRRPDAFADAACTRPLYRCQRDCQREQVIRWDAAACLEGPLALALHRLGPEVREGIFEDDAKAGCVPRPNPGGLYPAGAEISWDGYARLEEEPQAMLP